MPLRPLFVGQSARRTKGLVQLPALLIAFCSAAPALACGPEEYREAATLLADSSLRVDSSTKEAERVLQACGHDSLAKHLIGMFPRFAELPAEKREEHRGYLAQAAEDGVAAAAVVHGAWLFDAKQERERGAKLISAAYADGDEWAIAIVLRTMTAQQQRLSPETVAYVKQLSAQGFPLAYGIVVWQAMFRMRDTRDGGSFDDQVSELMKLHDLALQGIVQGDELALLAAVQIDQVFDVRPGGWDELDAALTTPDSIDFASSRPKQMGAAHVRWQMIFWSDDRLRPSGIDDSLRRLVKTAGRIYSGSIPSTLQAMCEIRAVTDHFICMQPFGAYMDERSWLDSSAYRTCRLLRLRVRPDALYY